MGYGRFVGRVGALAVALGVGLAGPAVAAADPGEESSADGSSPGGTGAGDASAASASPSSPGAGSGSGAESGSTDDTDDTDDADDADDADDTVDMEAPGDPADMEDPDEELAELDDEGLADATDPVLPTTADAAPADGDSGGDAGPDVGDAEVAAGGTEAADAGSDAENLDDDSDYGAGTDAGAGPAPLSVADPQETSQEALAIDAGESSGERDDDALAVTFESQESVSAEVAVADMSSAASVPAPVAPELVGTGVSGVVSKFLGLLGIGPAASGNGIPLPSFEFVTAVFGAIRREMDRLFSNHGPTAVPVLTSQAVSGSLSGSLGVVDPEGDPVTYTVTEAPSHGTVTVDGTGGFVYTPGAGLVATGGTDTFVVAARDTGFRLISAGPTTTQVPVTVTVGAGAASGAPAAAADDAPAPTESAALAAAQNDATTGGSVFQVSTSGPDIVGFDPSRDKLDLGDVSVHNFIVVDTAEGVGFRNPWSGDTAIVQGVSLGQLTVDSFTPVVNDHLRQDLSGALAWEQGVTAAPDTVYARSHEVGQIDRVAFDAATDVVDFRYFGTREQLYMTDSPEGVVISNAGTGQALILQGVTTEDLSATNFVFHRAQVREDRLHLQLGIGAVPDSQVLPQGVAIAGTDNWPTAAGGGTPPTGQFGTTTEISWDYGAHTAVDFDPAADELDFGWFKAHEFAVDEVAGSTRIAIVDNNQSYTLTGVGLGELQMSNIVALDDGARAKWQTLIYNAAPPASSPNLSVSDASVAEGDTGTSPLTFTVTLSEQSDETVTVGYTTANGTATAAGADYLPTVGTLSFAPGETTKTVAVTVNGDTMVELDEQLTLNLSAPVNAVIADGAGTGTIVNDDVDQTPATPPAVSISDLAVTEGDGEHSHFMFTVSLDKAPTETVTVGYATGDGTAVAGADYTATSGTVTFAAGVTTQLVHVDVIGDTAVEGDETFTVTLSNPSGVTIGDGSAVGTIADDDLAPDPDPDPEPEPDPTPGSSSVDYLVRDDWGSGFVADVEVTAGSEFDGWTVQFDTPAQISNIWNAEIVSHVGDRYVVRNAAWNAEVAEGQSVQFGFQAAPGGGSSAVSGFVVNGSPTGGPAPALPTVSIADTSVAEGDDGQTHAMFIVTLDKASEEPVSIGYATSDGTAVAGVDYTAGSGVLTFAPGVTSQMVHVVVAGDTAVEGDETFAVTLSNPSGATVADGSAVATIADDDVAPPPAPGSSSVEYVVRDDWGSGFVAAVTVTAGSDFDGWTVEFDSPAEIGNIWNAEIVSHVGDRYVVRNAAWNADVAAGQSVEFGFQAAPGGGSSAVSGFVVNGSSTGGPAPTLPTVSVADATATETDGGTTEMTFVVTLSEASEEPVSIGYATSNGTALAGVDYTVEAGTITFAPGTLTQQISVSILGDSTAELDETFTMTLSNPVGAAIADGTATGTIVNDDVINPANLMLSISDASVTEGAPGSGQVAPGWLHTEGNQILDSAGNPVQIAGVNWFGMESDIYAPHGLWTRNYKDMMDQMVELEFNTIRLPYSSEMLHTTSMPSGIDYSQNPELAGLAPIEVMDEIIRYADEVGLRVILDHHRSGAGAGASENGLWYDSQYTEEQWIADWQFLAQRYADDPTVIGADLHNEPHNGTWGGGGANDWAAAAERAGNAVLEVNPNWLIFVEGVASYEGENYWWGGNLMGVADRPIVLDVPGRVVYSPHDYPNSVYNQPWFQGADFGEALPDKFEQMWGYIYEQDIAPIYLGEFGTRLSDPKDVVWYEAITSYLSGDFDNDGTIDIAADTEDMSWTFWSWNPNSSDTGGILADDWRTVNDDKLVYLESLQFDFDEESSGVLANFVVTLAEPSNQTVTVAYATSDGTATAGSDYVVSSGTLTFAPGETSKTISVLVFGDTDVEGTESFLVTLSSPTGATIGDGSGTGTITDGSAVS